MTDNLHLEYRITLLLDHNLIGYHNLILKFLSGIRELHYNYINANCMIDIEVENDLGIRSFKLSFPGHSRPICLFLLASYNNYNNYDVQRYSITLCESS